MSLLLRHRRCSGCYSELPRWECAGGQSPTPVPTVPTVLLEKKAEVGLQETILGVQLQVPGVVELHIHGLLEQHGPVGSSVLRIKYNLLGTVLG